MAVVTPYVTKSSKSAQDGRFYGTIEQDGAVVYSVVEGQDAGFKSEKDFDAAAQKAAVDHKASVTPAPTHVIEKSFTV